MEIKNNLDKVLKRMQSVQQESKITSIKLSSETKQRLDKFKVYRRETYEEILIKILEILNLCRTNPERASSKLSSIDKQHRRLTKD